MSYRGDLWSPVYDYCKLLFNGIVSISRIICSNKIRVERGGQYAPKVKYYSKFCNWLIYWRIYSSFYI